MLFITNRAFKEGKTSVAGRTVNFDLEDNEAQQSVYFCERADDAFALRLLECREW